MNSVLQFIPIGILKRNICCHIDITFNFNQEKSTNCGKFIIVQKSVVIIWFCVQISQLCCDTYIFY